MKVAPGMSLKRKDRSKNGHSRNGCFVISFMEGARCPISDQQRAAVTGKSLNRRRTSVTPRIRNAGTTGYVDENKGQKRNVPSPSAARRNPLARNTVAGPAAIIGEQGALAQPGD